MDKGELLDRCIGEHAASKVILKSCGEILDVYEKSLRSIPRNLILIDITNILDWIRGEIARINQLADPAKSSIDIIQCEINKIRRN